jgi:hypothetical protein
MLAAVPCLFVAAYLAFDWADYGADSSCGNFIRRKSWSGACSDIMWHRTFAVVGLALLAVLVVVLACLRRDGDTPARVLPGR